ncbi:RsmE family RNA methyltransferase [Poriferisphaera sp. WC338]|uniref:RsmE family RNA methyltransferase n=1 Tax=Poriferisphaera sp. WC338 TaxID=3425129 RepID=UPI003D8180F6
MRTVRLYVANLQVLLGQVIDPTAGLNIVRRLSAIVPVVVGGDQGKHAARVLRMQMGDEVEVFDGEGLLGCGEIVRTSKNEIEVGVREMWVERKGIEDGVELRVLSAVPKGSRVDVMIDGLSQVGVTVWGPVVCERSAVVPSAKEGGSGKLGRLETRAVESAKQCGRAWVMDVDGWRSFTEIISAADLEGEKVMRLMMDLVNEEEGVTGDEIRKLMAGVDRVEVLVGPEGGWTDEERAAAKAAGWISWQVGQTVMRIETAAVVGAGVVLAGLGGK